MERPAELAFIVVSTDRLMDMTKMKPWYSIALILIAPWLATPAEAEAEVTISSTAYQDLKLIDEQGNASVQRIEAVSAKPGEELVFIISVENQGDQDAVNIQVDNPVPEGTSYIGFSQSSNTQSYLVSDNGVDFFPESELADTELRPQDIRYLHWTIEKLEANDLQQLEFKVTVN